MSGTQTNVAGTPAAVQAGTQIRITHNKGTVLAALALVASLPQGSVNEIDITDEGDITFVDLTAKTELPRRTKIDAVRANGTVIADCAFYSETHRKYGTIIRCEMCGVPTRKYTSDLHQSKTCSGCAVKAKRARTSAKRKEKTAAKAPAAAPASA